MARSRQWHVESTLNDDGAPEVLFKPFAASIMLVLGSTNTLAAMRGTASRECSRTGQYRPPVVGVLFGCGSPLDLGDCVRAQQELLASGFDDVLPATRCSSDFELTVQLCVGRCEATQAAVFEMEQELMRSFDRELRVEVERLEQEREREPTSGMFWRSVHKLYDGLPKLRLDLDEKPCTGTQIGDRRLDKPLGQGGFGFAYSATNSMGGIEAVKVIDKRSLGDLHRVSKLWRETRAMRMLKHPNVVRCIEIVHSAGHLYIAMEHAGQDNLATVLRRHQTGLELERARRYQSQVVGAMAYCHAKGVVHRDLKPENIAVSNCGTIVKILDFGCVAAINSLCQDMSGTMPFIAPEVLCARIDGPYKPAGCDTWASAVVLTEMLCGMGKLNRLMRWDFKIEPSSQQGAELANFFGAPENGPQDFFKELAALNEHVADMVEGMLQVDPELRWTFEQVSCSPWLFDLLGGM